MEREIKFKVWDKAEKRMSSTFDLTASAIHFEQLVSGEKYDDFVPVEFAATRSERFEFLQFSGYKDRFGQREIYENDSIKAFDYDRSDWYQGAVVFEDGAFCLRIEKCLTEESKPPFPRYEVGQTPPLYEFEYFKVIGTIHD